MTKLKLHYDGWLTLPAAFRRQLGLHTDAVLEAELVDGTIVLRPAAGAKGSAAPAPEPETIVPAAANASPMPSTHSRTPKRPRGRPRRVVAPPPAPEPAPVVLEEAARCSELRRRVVLPPAAGPEPAAPLVRGRRSGRGAGGGGGEREERRPFRHVQVRKLGPGRGHNRPRGPSAQP